MNRRIYHRRTWKGAASLLLAAVLASGQQGPEARLKQLSLGQLGSVEVTTASRAPVKVARTPAAVHVISQEDIRRSGATSIPEALRLAPGVEVARIDSVKWSLGIRGFGGRLSRAVLVLIDGRNVYSPLFAGVYWEVQDTLIQDVDRIEIIRGPGATIWGPNAVNGVVNIITKRAKETRGQLVSTGAGNDQRFSDFRYGSGNGRNLDYRVYGKVFHRTAEFHRDNSRFDEWQMGRTGFRMDWDLNQRDAVTLQGDLYKGSIGERTQLGRGELVPPVIVEEDSHVSGGNLLSRWRRDLGGGSDLQVQTYYDRTNRREPDFVETRDTFDIDFLHHAPLGRRHDVIWGGGARLSSGRIPQVVPNSFFTPNNRVDQMFTAFLQDEITLAENRLWLTLGSKLLRTSFSSFEPQPSARLLLTPSNRQTWWAAVTRAVRTPSDVERSLGGTAFALANPLVVTRVIPNRQFVSEKLIGYEAGYRSLLHRRFYVDINTFRNRYSDLLSREIGAPFLERTPAPARYVYPISLGNGLYGSTSGFEIAPNWRPTARWQLDGSYSYLSMNLKVRPESIDTLSEDLTEGASPRHQVVARSSFDLPGKLEFSQTYRYVSALRAQQVKSYHTADAWVSWRPGKTLEFSVTGRNLLQPYHPEFGGNQGGLVGIRRTIYAAVTWRR